MVVKTFLPNVPHLTMNNDVLETFARAQEKLKAAEDTLDINTCTDVEIQPPPKRRFKMLLCDIGMTCFM